jgi:hypothetical protein
VRRIGGQRHQSEDQGSPPHGLLLGDGRDGADAGADEADVGEGGVGGGGDVADCGGGGAGVGGVEPGEVLFVAVGKGVRKG